MSHIRIVVQTDRDILGEDSIWFLPQKALFWVDNFGQKIHRLHPTTGEVMLWVMPERIGWTIERRSTADFVAVLKSGFAFVQLDPLTIQPIGNLGNERPFNRQNDAIADGQERVWAGSKDDRDMEATGALHRLDPDPRWQRMGGHCKVTNGPAFSLGYRTLYHTDTLYGTVYAFDVASDGTLTNRRICLKVLQEWGDPAGMSTDTEGGIWIVHWGGARISPFFPDGTLEQRHSYSCDDHHQHRLRRRGLTPNVCGLGISKLRRRSSCRSAFRSRPGDSRHFGQHLCWLRSFCSGQNTSVLAREKQNFRIKPKSRSAKWRG